MISKHILLITSLNEPEPIFFLSFFSTHVDGFYLKQVILFTINHLFVHSLMCSSIAI